MTRRLGAAVLVGLFGAVGVVAPASVHAAGAPPEARVGRWTDPFAEPTIDGKPTTATCVPDDDPHHDGADKACKPTAGSMAILGGADTLYWDALESMEDVEHSVVLEFGAVSENDQSRLLHLGSQGPSWSTPSPADAGATATPDP